MRTVSQPIYFSIRMLDLGSLRLRRLSRVECVKHGVNTRFCDFEEHAAVTNRVRPERRMFSLELCLLFLERVYGSVEIL